MEESSDSETSQAEEFEINEASDLSEAESEPDISKKAAIEWCPPEGLFDYNSKKLSLTFEPKLFLQDIKTLETNAFFDLPKCYDRPQRQVLRGLRKLRGEKVFSPASTESDEDLECFYCGREFSGYWERCPTECFQYRGQNAADRLRPLLDQRTWPYFDEEKLE